ncbi:MAG: SCO family protein [Myxococcota bacterium]
MAKGIAGVLLAALLVACGRGAETRVYEGRGVVRDVNRELGQLVVAHEEIVGLMPAMTMNFDVADPVLFESVEPGQVIAFRLEASPRSYRLLGWSVLEVGAAGEGTVLDGLAAETDPAPDFQLIDQAGEPLGLSDLAGRAVLLDFIYTSCPGPCPVLTGLHVDAQRALPDALRDRVRFVSISLDPERDGPLELSAYARARGVDLAGWSFLTGEPALVAEVVEGFGVGHVRSESGEIDHLVATFVIDPEGRIVRRFLGLEHSPEQIVQALERAAG